MVRRSSTIKLESDIQSRILKKLKSRGYFPVKLISTNCNGIPDIMVVEPRGFVSWIEVKRPGKTSDPLQDVRQEQLKDYGCTVSRDVIDWEEIEHLYPQI